MIIPNWHLLKHLLNSYEPLPISIDVSPKSSKTSHERLGMFKNIRNRERNPQLNAQTGNEISQPVILRHVQHLIFKGPSEKSKRKIDKCNVIYRKHKLSKNTEIQNRARVCRCLEKSTDLWKQRFRIVLEFAGVSKKSTDLWKTHNTWTKSSIAQHFHNLGSQSNPWKDDTIHQML
jgi:hypothetical protein